MNDNVVINSSGYRETTKREYKKIKGKGLVEYNSLVNLLDRSFHSMGQSLISEETILPLYVSNFTSSKFIVGLIPFLQALLFSLPQLFSLTKPLKKFRSLKNQIIFFGVLERLPWLILGILTLFINKTSSTFILVSFFLFYSIYVLSWGYPIPIWFNFIRGIIADHKKGSFFGTTLILKNVFGFIGGILLSFLLNAASFPLNFSYTFIFAFIIMSVSLLFFSLNKKSLEYTPPEKSSYRTIFSLFSVLGDDTEFLFLSVSFIFSTMLFSMIPFLSLYAKGKFNIPDTSGGILTAVFFLGQTIGSIIGSHFGNKRDYKKLMFLSLLFGMATVFIAMFAKTMFVYYTSFLLVGLFLGTRKLSFIVYVINLSTKEKTPLYIAVTNNISMPFQISFPLIAALIVEYLSYNTLFLLTFFFLILSLFFFFLATIKSGEIMPETGR